MEELCASGSSGVFGLDRVFGLARFFGLGRGLLGFVWRGCVL